MSSVNCCWHSGAEHTKLASSGVHMVVGTGVGSSVGFFATYELKGDETLAGPSCAAGGGGEAAAPTLGLGGVGEGPVTAACGDSSATTPERRSTVRDEAGKGDPGGPVAPVAADAMKKWSLLS